MNNCYFDGEVTAENTDGVGGLAGKLTGSISYCYFVGDVRGGTKSGALAGNLDSAGLKRIFGSFAVPLNNNTSANAIGNGSSNSLLYVKLVRRSTSYFCYGTDTSTCDLYDPTDVGEFHGSGFELFDYQNTWKANAGEFPTLKSDSLTKANSPALIALEGEGTFDSPIKSPQLPTGIVFQITIICGTLTLF